MDSLLVAFSVSDNHRRRQIRPGTCDLQQLRRIFHELSTLGDTIAAARQGHLLLDALSGKPYDTFKSYVQCETMRSGGIGMQFADIARQATQFHAT